MPTLQERYTKVLTKTREYTFTGELPTDDGVEEAEIRFRFRKLTQKDYLQLMGDMRRKSRQWEGDDDLRLYFEGMLDIPDKQGIIDELLMSEGLVVTEFDDIRSEVVAALTEARVRVGAVDGWLEVGEVTEQLDKLLGEAHQMSAEDYHTSPQLEGEDDEGVVERHLAIENEKLKKDIEKRTAELSKKKPKELKDLWLDQRMKDYVAELSTAFFIHGCLVKEVEWQVDGKWEPALSDPDTVQRDLPLPLYNFLMECHQDFNKGFVDLEELAMYSPFRSVLGSL